MNIMKLDLFLRIFPIRIHVMITKTIYKLKLENVRLRPIIKGIKIMINA